MPYEFAYLTGEDLENYLHDMKIVQNFAQINRRAIASDIVKGLKFTEIESFSTIHNYIDVENKILRKGAISAKDGERIIIPLNMRDGALICMGKGNAEWNSSAPTLSEASLFRSIKRKCKGFIQPQSAAIHWTNALWRTKIHR